MNHFILEAFFVGIKEGFKLFFCAALLVTFFQRIGRKALLKPLFTGILFVFLASLAMAQVPITVETTALLARLIGFTFALFYLFSLAALFHTSGVDILGPFKPFFKKNYFLIPLVFFLTIGYFIPDMTGSSLYLKDLFSLSGNRFAIPVSSGGGFVFAVFLASFILRKIKIEAIRLFGLSEVLLLLALVKLVAGGVRGFAELSLIPAVQAGLMKLTHDVVHHLLITVMVPDHPILSMTAWKFVGTLFSDTLALWLSLIIMTLPLVLFIKKHFSRDMQIPLDLAAGPLKRSFIKTVRDERVLKSIPVFLFLLIIVTTWFYQKGEAASLLYKPEPVPVAAEQDMVTLPLHNPAGDLLDGALHKFSIMLNGESIRLLAMKRTNNTLAVCLDACEMCPPEGYGQAKGHVVCLYCKTPIPIDSLGNPGGCNPVPLSAVVTDTDVRIRIQDITEKWGRVKSRRVREESMEK